MKSDKIEVRISFDYELLWGVWDKVPTHYVTSNVANANAATRGLLACHRKHNIPCTFAIVGAMLEGDQTPQAIMQISQRPDGDKVGFRNALTRYTDSADITRAPDDIVEILKNDPLFEVGSHTQTHIYALEASFASLEADFIAFEEIFKRRFGTSPRILVMPKNQVTSDILRIATTHGFDSVRVNPNNWIYRPVVWGPVMARLIRLIRFADTFLPLMELGSADQFVERYEGSMRIHVGQYFLRPWFIKKGLFTMHLLRLKLALFLARIRGHQVHFWLHPHNMGRNTTQALANYDLFLSWLKRLEKEGAICFAHMSSSEGNTPCSVPPSCS